MLRKKTKSSQVEIVFDNIHISEWHPLMWIGDNLDPETFNRLIDVLGERLSEHVMENLQNEAEPEPHLAVVERRLTL